MILVTLGTQDKPFTRLLQAVERAIEAGEIHDRVVAQAGYTKFTSANMEVFDYIDQQQFSQFLRQADLLITHGGVGTIMTGLRAGKKILAAPRLAKYKEHHNDHQTQLLDAFANAGYLIYMHDLQDIGPYLKQAETFIPETYVSNQMNMIQRLEKFIEKNEAGTIVNVKDEANL